MSNEWMRPYLTFDPDEFKWAQEAEMIEKIWVFLKLNDKTEMTRQYFDELVWLLVSQMDSEYAGAYGYMPITYICPRVGAHELESVSRIVHEETKHGERIQDILNNIGFDADRWVQDHWEQYHWRLQEGEKLSRGRPTRDLRLNIFYYDIVSRNPDLDEMSNQRVTVTNFGVFQVDQDRGAGEQLRDTLDSSFLPWAEANKRTMSEENFHINHGDKWLKKLFNEYPDLVERQFDIWWPRVLATFGRPESKRNELWRKFGLKRRTNEKVLRAFLDRAEHPVGLQIAAREIGLKIRSTEQIIEMWRKGDYLNDI